MSHSHLLGAASAVALAFVSSVAFAQQATTIQGGGSTLAEFDYFKEFAAYNASAPLATFTLLHVAISLVGILDADRSLYAARYDSAETCFAFVVQAAGRQQGRQGGTAAR